jgi:hypothetical protein
VIRIGLGQVAHRLFFDEVALASQQPQDARDDLNVGNPPSRLGKTSA